MKQLSSLTARDYMTRDLVTFTPDMEVMSAIHMLISHRVSGAPVLDAEGHIIGVLSEKDCLKVAILAGMEGVAGGTVQEFMSHAIESVDVSCTLMEIASRFLDASFKRFPVVEKGQLVGQISRSDILRAIDDLY